MVLNAALAPAVVTWHDLECGSYRADLELWSALAAERPRGLILDIGAGTGRVSLALARSGHELLALDRDGELLGALRSRAAGLPVQTICADARSFSLEQDEISLGIVPMQTIQLLDGRRGRLAFFERARACLRSDGALACAIATDFEPYDARAGEAAPAPEWTVQGELLYASRALRLQLRGETIEIERERRVGMAQPLVELLSPQRTRRGRAAVARALWDGLQSRGSRTRDLVVLDRVSAALLGEEAQSAGFAVRCLQPISATAEHGASAVVVLDVR